MSGLVGSGFFQEFVINISAEALENFGFFHYHSSRMPRYFFDFYAGHEYHPDFDGTVLSNVREARYEALQMIAEIIKETIPLGDHITTSLAVKAEDKTFLFKVTVSVSIDNEWAL